MTKKRPVFSPEFKREAAELVIDKGYSIYKACEARGVSESALRRWVDQLRNELTGETPESARALTAEHQEIQALKCLVPYSTSNASRHSLSLVLKEQPMSFIHLLTSTRIEPISIRCFAQKQLANSASYFGI